MSSTQQGFNAGQTKGRTQAKVDDWTETVKDKANDAFDNSHHGAQCTSDSAQEKKEQAAGFLQQTGEQVVNMAQGAIDSVKNTLGMGEKK